MRLLLKIFLLLISLPLIYSKANAQFVLSGTVLDSSKINYVPGVKVINKLGKFTFTDSMGRYSLSVVEKDSVVFIFREKATQKFGVQSIANPNNFDIQLHVNYKGKYSTLKEVVVFSKTYQQDSIENRALYSSIYRYEKPTFKTSIGPSGTVGADANELINIFRFKRNKRLKQFQARLEADEQEKYVTYRFNKTLVKKLTHLEGDQLTTFMIKFRPSYEFASEADELVFNQYILNCSYKFKIEMLQR